MVSVGGSEQRNSRQAQTGHHAGPQQGAGFGQCVHTIRVVRNPGGRSDSPQEIEASQLRDSDGFSPFFPRFLQWLIPTETRNHTLQMEELAATKHTVA